jgi:seryl-tRNA synthetase
MGVDGVYARTALYVHVVERLEAYITRQRDPRAEVMRFPPVMSRKQLEKSGYLKSFPNLLGCVCALHGSEASIRSAVERHDNGGDWTTSATSSDLVLSPAACYPVYPIVAARGPLAATMGYTANDPFFGRVGQVMAVSQRQQALKFELLIPYYPGAAPTACMSFNYHREHFGQVWGIRDHKGEMAHTGCVAFGIDRLTVALFAIHGLDLQRWPSVTKAALAL